MSLHFILGGSGSGKSTWLFKKIQKDASGNPGINYLVLVPDQFTLETQKTLVSLNGNKGILNIDVLSFHRLAYRAFEEVPALRRTVLEDMGKIMILYQVFSKKKKEMLYFKRGLNAAGFLDECKSLLCELAQYDVSEEALEELTEKVGEDSLLGLKLHDIRLVYQAFTERMGDTYMMAEELVPQLTRVVSSLEMMKHCVVCLDGFTGFTPTQYELLREILGVCEDMYITVTTDRTGHRDRVFSMSADTIRRLTQMAGERGVLVEEPVITGAGREKIPYRVAKNEELAFMEERLFTHGFKPWEKVPESIHITMCHRERDEVSYVARRIYWLMKEGGYEPEDIAVVTADEAAYEPLLVQEFEKLGIRYFLDSTKSIGANAMAEYLLAFIHMVQQRLDYESTFRFLRCALSPLTREQTDCLENYVIARGCRGMAAYQSEWEYAVSGLDLLEVNEYRRIFVNSIAETLQALKGGKKSVREFTEIFYGFAEKNGIYERLLAMSENFENDGKLILAREYKSIYRLMIHLWDEFVELLGDEIVTFKEYTQMLEAGISEGIVGFIPPTAKQVMIGDVTRSRLKNIKVLFFLGVNDNCIPKAKGAPGLLTERERERMEKEGVTLAPDAEKESYNEQFYLYLALTKASEQVILTYSVMTSKGESKRPSYLINRVKQVFPKLVVEKEESDTSYEKIMGSDKGKSYLISHLADGTYAKDVIWWEIASHYEKKTPGILKDLLRIREKRAGNNSLKKEAAKRLFGDVLYGSVTRFEQYVQCPFAFFAHYGLLLNERQQYEISSLDHGNLFHQAMEHLSHELEQRNKNWQDLSEEEAVSLAAECVDAVAERYQGRKYFQSNRVSFMLKRLKNEVVHSVWAMWHQMQEGDFVQTYTEKGFRGNDKEWESMCIPFGEDAKICLNGVIDRVDLCSLPGEELIKIIDYKSSDSQDLLLAKVYYGLQMQLLTYLEASKEMVEKEHKGKEAVPAAMLYYAIKEKNLDWKPESEEEYEKRVLDSMKCKGYVNEEPEIIGHLDKSVVNGGELIPGQKSGVVPVAVDKKGLLKKNSGALSTKDFETLIAHTKEKMKECGKAILDGKIEAIPYVYEDNDGCTYCPYGSVCGHESKKDGVREMKKMSDDEVWEALYGDD